MVTIDEAYKAGYDDGYSAAFARVQEMERAALDAMAQATTPPFGRPRGRIGTSDIVSDLSMGRPVAPSRPRKVSAYHKRLGREIKRLTKAHKTKAGKWKKGWNQKRLMKTAHRNTK